MQIYHATLLRDWLQCLDNVGLMSVQCDGVSKGNVVSISTDILLRLQGRDYKKARKERGTCAVKNKIKNKELEKEKEKNIKKEKVFRVSQERLDELYAAYPRKVGKSDGMQLCRQQLKSEADVEDLKNAIAKYRKNCEDDNREKQYVLHFSTFMRKGRWRDWLEDEAGGS